MKRFLARWYWSSTEAERFGDRLVVAGAIYLIAARALGWFPFA